MTKRLSTLLGLAALVALPALPAPAQTPPDFTGTWKLHQDAGATPSSRPRDTVFVIDHKEPRFKYSATGMRWFVPFSETYEFTTDGRMPSDPSKLAIAANWEGPTLVMKYLKGGKPVATIRLHRSLDGRQMIREVDLGNKPGIREVYDRR